MSSPIPWIRTRLSAMMFLEFLLWASWYVPIGGYMNSTLGYSGAQIGWICTTTAIGAILAPMFVGFVADRYFATERVLAVLHLVGALCLLLASLVSSFWLLMLLLIVNGLCFMPTLALCNSVAFRNIDDPDRFSRIAVFGTIGWIVSGLIVEFLMGGAVSGWFFFLAGGGALIMAGYCLSLPHTPPKGAESASGDVLGLGAVKLLQDPAFLVFAVCAFLISIPLSFYFTWGNAFLVETDRPVPTALMTLCQFSEIVVMLVMPWVIGRIGLKNVMVIGMGAWVVRYLLFSTLSLPLIVLGLLVHGFCYCFVFVASFIYVSKRSPPELSASAQSFVALLMWGVGMFIGTVLAGTTGGFYPPQTVAAVKQVAQGTENLPSAALPDWPLATLEAKDKQVPLDLGKAAGLTGPQAILLQWGEDQQQLVIGKPKFLGQVPEAGVRVERKLADGKVLSTTVYAKKDLLAALAKADANHDGIVTQAEWKEAQSHNWPPIWLWPALLAAIVCGLFWLGGKDVPPAEPQAAGPPTSEPERVG